MAIKQTTNNLFIAIKILLVRVSGKLEFYKVWKDLLTNEVWFGRLLYQKGLPEIEGVKVVGRS